MNYCVWLKDYTEKDIDPIAKFLDHEMPIPYGFVIPSSILTSIFLAPELQQKFIHLFESSNPEIETERKHIFLLVEKIIKSANTPRNFAASIHKAYENLLEKERDYLKHETHDLHRAYHLLKHVYAPPAVKVSFLPTSIHEQIVNGEIALQHAITDIIVRYFTSHVGSHSPLVVPSISVQRVLSPQETGVCVTVNAASQRNDQMVVYAYFGAKELEDAADVYVLQKETGHIISRHSVEQPFKYVFKGNDYKKLKLHPEDAGRSVLTDSQIQKVAFLAKDFEKEVYFPQKISFAFENGKLFVTKLRPV